MGILYDEDFLFGRNRAHRNAPELSPETVQKLIFANKVVLQGHSHIELQIRNTWQLLDKRFAMLRLSKS